MALLLPLLLLAACWSAAVASGPSKPCSAYAFWTDHGCRTWSTPCTKHSPTSKIETLSIRKPGTNDFTVAGHGIICAGAPDFRDGPRATPTDAACREHCLNGDHGIHGGGGGHGPPPGPPPAPTQPVTLTIDTGTPTHTISPLAMGCHSDSGYAHQARGFYSQMIVASSFDASGFPDGRWNVDPSVSVSQDTSALFHGTPSEEIRLSGTGAGGVSNRGLGNAGMVFEEGKPYEGFLFASLPAAGSALLVVTLEDYEAKKVLATQTLTITARNSSDFVRYNFTLTPSAATTCADITPGSDPAVSCGHGRPRSTIGHTCVKCAGQFKISLSKPGSVLVNYAFLQPGQWGRVPGQPVLLSAAKVLKEMGVKAIRQGGSFASSASDGTAHAHDMEYYQWERWTGDAWARASRSNGVWKKCLLAGWGPFEMIDMCNALGIEPVITTTDTSSVQEFADLVEYCHGDETTVQGKKRIADGHPAKYDVRYFELGNEQYNANYVEQVAAMEAKARSLGIGKTIHYMFPQNGFLKPEDIAKASQLSPRVDEQMVADLHVGGGGAVEQATALFAKHPTFKLGAVNAETNAGTHTFDRAMSEASDLNDWFNSAFVTTDNATSRLHFRAASFCMGDATDFDAWDQGISFFLPNGTWLQPPGYVHKMIDQSWQPLALNFSASVDSPTFSAQKSEDGKTLVLRYVNFPNDSPNKVTFAFATSDTEAAIVGGTATVWSLSSSDPGAANPPGQPSLISPSKKTIASFASGSSVEVEANSYTIVEVQLP